MQVQKEVHVKHYLFFLGYESCIIFYDTPGSIMQTGTFSQLYVKRAIIENVQDFMFWIPSWKMKWLSHLRVVQFPQMYWTLSTVLLDRLQLCNGISTLQKALQDSWTWVWELDEHQ